MSLPITLRPEAQAEYDEAFDWLEQFRAGCGVDFARAIKKALDLIAVHP